jgi:hypothetical protein
MFLVGYDANILSAFLYLELKHYHKSSFFLLRLGRSCLVVVHFDTCKH